MLPSLPLLLGSPWTRLCWVCVLPETTMFNLPRICIRSFAGASFARFARISVSRICSISPAPNTGVGILKITFFLFASKSGCVSWQPTAPAAPTMVNRSCTPPSGVPLLVFWNLASRVGPFSVIKKGSVLLRPSRLLIWNCRSEERVHTPIRCALTGFLESRFQGRSVLCDKEGQRVTQAQPLDDLELRIGLRARSPYRGLGVTSRTTVEVHARPQAISGDGVHFHECGLAGLEELEFAGCKVIDRAAGAGTGARPWVMSPGGLGLCGSA